MSELWPWLASLEQQLPLRQHNLEVLFGVKFASRLDHNAQPLLVAANDRYEIELRPATGSANGDLTVRFVPPFEISIKKVRAHLPDGHSLPPPPPGIGPPDLEGSYVAERAWGQLWFTFHRRSRLTQIALVPGAHGSPGV